MACTKFVQSGRLLTLRSASYKKHFPNILSYVHISVVANTFFEMHVKCAPTTIQMANVIKTKQVTTRRMIRFVLLAIGTVITVE